MADPSEPPVNSPSSDPNAWLTALLTPSPQTFLITFLAVLILPSLGHFIFFRQRRPKFLPTVVLLGPTGAGKTALLTSVCPSFPTFPPPF